MGETGKKRWFILGTGTIVLLFSGLIYGWSLFSGYFMELYPMWSLSQLSVTFTISMICLILGGLMSGRLSRKLAPAWILRLAGVLICSGFYVISMLDTADPAGSLIKLYIFYGIVSSLGVGLNFNIVLSTAGKWFPDRIGVSAGAMMMGFGCGALVLGGVATIIIGQLGLLLTFRILGILIAVVGICSSFIVRLPFDGELEAANIVCKSPDKSSKGNVSGREDMTSGEMLRSPSFWLFMAWAITLNIAGMMVIGNAANIAVYAGAPAILGMVVSICNGLGRISLGALFDVVGRVKTMGTNNSLLLIAGLLLTLGAVKNSIILVILGLVVMGIEYGGNPTITSSFARDEFGDTYYSTNFALLNTSVIPAAIIGPMLSSKLVEASGGNYQNTFIAIIVCAVLAGILFALINRKANQG